MSRTWGIILAAGSSRRMKAAKLSLPYKGSTILEWSIDQVLHSGVNDVMVVLGAYRDLYLELVGDRPVMTCFNKEHKSGMLSSVQCGIRAIPEDAEAVLVFPADQPMISSGITNKILRAWHEKQYGLVVPFAAGKKGHPLLIDMKYREEIKSLNPDIGLRELLQRHPEDLFLLETEDHAILCDIDTPEDYMKMTEKK